MFCCSECRRQDVQATLIFVSIVLSLHPPEDVEVERPIRPIRPICPIRPIRPIRLRVPTCVKTPD